jgi:D-beta-D-heptose 7-phosphate kinase/D-beta-D-heptose 1-phosphate adenosyltransferase
MRNNQRADILGSFANQRVLVIGDLILDIYLNGTTTRISPEAPVPVVDIDYQKMYLGGAANAACNFRSLGADVTFCTATGNDSSATEALAILKEMEIETKNIFQIPSRQTLVKTRIVSGGQVIARFDKGTQHALPPEASEILAQSITRDYEWYDAIVISDYDKGIVTYPVMEAIADLQRKHKKFLAIDSKRLPFFKSLAATFVKPNYDEAIKLLQLKTCTKGRLDQLIKEGHRLYEKTGADLIGVTMDQDGSLFFEQGEASYWAHAPAVAAPHVAGAGDTFLAGFVLAYASCRQVQASAEIATAAATIAIRKESTSTCSANELKTYFQLESKSVASLYDMHKICESYRQAGKRVVFTNGCFDILHSGHVTYLHRAKELGDVLIVGINTDESIRRLKGPRRPINSLPDRVEVLSALSVIDHIIPFGSAEDDTPISLIETIRPDIFVKGGDYTREKLPEAEAVDEAGGKIIFIPLVPDHSTTSIIEKINAFAEESTIAQNE